MRNLERERQQANIRAVRERLGLTVNGIPVPPMTFADHIKWEYPSWSDRFCQAVAFGRSDKNSALDAAYRICGRLIAGHTLSPEDVIEERKQELTGLGPYGADKDSVTIIQEVVADYFEIPVYLMKRTPWDRDRWCEIATTVYVAYMLTNLTIEDLAAAFGCGQASISRAKKWAKDQDHTELVEMCRRAISERY